MTNNTRLNAGSGGDMIVTEDIGTRGAKVQVVKLMLGADGVDGGNLAAANPLPIAGTVSIDGTVPVSAGSALPVSIGGTVPVSIAANVNVRAAQSVDASNSAAISGTTSSRTASVTTTSGSRTITSAGLFSAADLGASISGTGIPANAIIIAVNSTSSVTFQAAPQFPTLPNPSATASGTITATIRAGYSGTFAATRSAGVVRLLTVLASTVTSGLGGTFCFEFSEDGTTSTISEVRSVTDFSSVRDFDLINAGAYYRVMFAPSRDLTSGEQIFVTTSQRTQNDGAFVRLADQVVERTNAAMGMAFAFLKAFDDAGGSQNISADVVGSLYVNTAGRKTTYSAISVWSPAATPTDVFLIKGSATKLVRVREIVITGTNTLNTNIAMSIIKRSTDDTGGTSSTLSATPMDSTSAAATATVRSYSANPTVGTQVGTPVRSQYIFLPALTSQNAIEKADLVFGSNASQAVVLRGASECLAVNLGGAMIGGTTSLSIRIEWTEE